MVRASVAHDSCEEGLCSECLKHHSVSKYTKSHEVISIENYNKIPQSVSNIVQHCTEHDRQHQNYCPIHESLCCPLCISENHNACIGLLAIENIVKTAFFLPEMSVDLTRKASQMIIYSVTSQ
jgi:hypothetical protein